MNFDNKIKQWIYLDNQVKILNDQIKKIREQRSSLENNLTIYAKNNDMINTAINVNNDKLKFIETKVQEPLTFKYLEKTLGEIIKNEAQVKIIMEHIKQKRSIKTIPEIKRFNNN